MRMRKIGVILAVILSIGGLRVVAIDGLQASLSVLSPPAQVDLQIYQGASVGRCVQRHEFSVAEGRSVVRLSLAGLPISRDVVEIDLEGASVISRSHPADMPDSILLELDSPSKAKCTASLTYYMRGLDWKGVYGFYSNEEEDSAVLVGYARVINRTEQEFRDVKITLATLTQEVLQEILRILGPEEKAVTMVKLEVPPSLSFSMAPSAAPPPPVVQVPEVGIVPVGEYWELALPEKYDLPQRGEVDVLVVSAPEIKGEVVYTFGTAAERRGFRFLEVKNDEKHGLQGTPFMPGVLWVCFKGPSGAYAYSLSESIEYQPPGAKVRFPIGRAKDVTCERRVVAYSVHNLTYVADRGVVFDAEKTVEFKVRNLTGAPVTVELMDRLDAGAEIIEASHEYEQPSAIQIKVTLPIEPGNVEVVSYRVRYREITPAHPIAREIQAMEVNE